MRIDAYNQIQQLYGVSNVKKTEEKKVAKASFRDELMLSAAGRDSQIARQAIVNAPEIREELVNPIKEKMNNGTYEVTAEEFADKLLDKYNGLF